MGLLNRPDSKLLSAGLATAVSTVISVVGLMAWQWNYFSIMLLFWLNLNLGQLRQAWPLATTTLWDRSVKRRGDLVVWVRSAVAGVSGYLIVVCAGAVNPSQLKAGWFAGPDTLAILLFQNPAFNAAMIFLIAKELALGLREGFQRRRAGPSAEPPTVNLFCSDDLALALSLVVALLLSILLTTWRIGSDWPAQVQGLVLSLPAVALVLASGVVKVWSLGVHRRTD